MKITVESWLRAYNLPRFIKTSRIKCIKCGKLYCVRFVNEFYQMGILNTVLGVEVGAFWLWKRQKSQMAIYSKAAASSGGNGFNKRIVFRDSSNMTMSDLRQNGALGKLFEIFLNAPNGCPPLPPVLSLTHPEFQFENRVALRVKSWLLLLF